MVWRDVVGGRKKKRDEAERRGEKGRGKILVQKQASAAALTAVQVQVEILEGSSRYR